MEQNGNIIYLNIPTRQLFENRPRLALFSSASQIEINSSNLHHFPSKI